ncbi:MAG: hypothetical protein GDA41_06520 [Rhodospirillales bacterium]|nr:hypothetical protein [Rhodospirillales bacterium]
MHDERKQEDLNRVNNTMQESGGLYLKWALIVNSGAIIAALSSVSALAGLSIGKENFVAAIGWWVTGAAMAITSFGIRYLTAATALFHIAAGCGSRRLYRLHIACFAATAVTGLAASLAFLGGALTILP